MEEILEHESNEEPVIWHAQFGKHPQVIDNPKRDDPISQYKLGLRNNRNDKSSQNQRPVNSKSNFFKALYTAVLVRLAFISVLIIAVYLIQSLYLYQTEHPELIRGLLLLNGILYFIITYSYLGRKQPYNLFLVGASTVALGYLTSFLLNAVVFRGFPISYLFYAILGLIIDLAVVFTANYYWGHRMNEQNYDKIQLLSCIALLAAIFVKLGMPDLQIAGLLVIVSLIVTLTIYVANFSRLIFGISKNLEELSDEYSLKWSEFLIFSNIALYMAIFSAIVYCQRNNAIPSVTHTIMF